MEIIPDLRRRALDVSVVVAHRRNLSRRVRLHDVDLRRADNASGIAGHIQELM